MAEAKSGGRVLPWFAAFLAAMVAMVIFVDMAGIKDKLVATGLMLLPALLLVPMVRNAMANSGQRGASGAPSVRYLKRMAMVSIVYLASLFLAEHMIEDGTATPFSIALAIVPGLAVAGYFWAIGRYMTELTDEFLRMLLVRQTLIATAFAFSAAAIYGFLENFELVPHVDAYWWPIAFFLGFAIGAVANKLQFGTYGECA